MSQWDQFNNGNDGIEPDPASGSYVPESSADIYDTPDVTGETADVVSAEELSETDVIVEDGSGQGAVQSVPAQYGNNNPYGNGSQYGSNNPYGNGSQYGSNNPYGNGSQYGNNNNPYGNGGQYGNNNPYGNGSQYGNNNPYGNGSQYGNNNNPYGNGSQYGSNNPYGNNGQYGNNNNPYGNGGQYGNNNNPYGSGSQYGNNNNPYGNGQYGDPYNAPYSPYAAPPKKNKNGLIIGIVVTVIVLFLIALFALVYNVGKEIMKDNGRDRSVGDDYDFDYDDDGWGTQHDSEHGYDDDPGYDDDYGYDEDPGYDDGQSGEYYDLHDEQRWDLSYVVDFEEYYEEEDDADGQNGGREIFITYPVIAGDNVPNLDSLNRTIMDEVDFLQDVAEDVEEDTYVYLSGEAYVTYMDEEKLSIVFKEDLYLTYEDGGQDINYYLYSLNIDMENGVVLDNQSLIRTDDDFSVDFRQRSDKQNGEIEYLTMLSDQEITEYFTSDDIIVFYTPLGMEIGFNYEYGWVTVTYKDYEQYLKVF